MLPLICELFFFLKNPAPPEISPLPLHDALPIKGKQLPARGPGGPSRSPRDPLHSCHPAGIRSLEVCPPQADCRFASPDDQPSRRHQQATPPRKDRKSTRLNSSHGYISYAVFCLK